MISSHSAAGPPAGPMISNSLIEKGSTTGMFDSFAVLRANSN